jgi:multisubunit Na+/H+ antiporter MnhG subunit
MVVNGFLSPYGLGGLLILFQATGMSLIGLAGGVYSRTVADGKAKWMSVEVAILGAFLTLVYDLITNLGYALQFSLFTNSVIVSFIGVLVAGSVFMVIHVVSNTVLFMTSIPIVKGIQKLLGR